jgi:hypothetical protein
MITRLTFRLAHYYVKYRQEGFQSDQPCITEVAYRKIYWLAVLLVRTLLRKQTQ